MGSNVDNGKVDSVACSLLMLSFSQIMGLQGQPDFIPQGGIDTLQALEQLGACLGAELIRASVIDVRISPSSKANRPSSKSMLDISSCCKRKYKGTSGQCKIPSCNCSALRVSLSAG